MRLGGTVWDCETVAGPGDVSLTGGETAQQQMVMPINAIHTYRMDVRRIGFSRVRISGIMVQLSRELG